MSDPHERDMATKKRLMEIAKVWYDQMDAINWIGIYWSKQDELLVGPFQGKPACSPLNLDHGVCAAAISQCSSGAAASRCTPPG